MNLPNRTSNQVRHLYKYETFLSLKISPGTTFCSDRVIHPHTGKTLPGTYGPTPPTRIGHLHWFTDKNFTVYYDNVDRKSGDRFAHL